MKVSDFLDLFKEEYICSIDNGIMKEVIEKQFDKNYEECQIGNYTICNYIHNSDDLESDYPSVMFIAVIYDNKVIYKTFSLAESYDESDNDSYFYKLVDKTLYISEHYSYYGSVLVIINEDNVRTINLNKIEFSNSVNKGSGCIAQD